MARAPRRLQGALVLAVILPFWTSFLIRVYAWMNILQHDGLLNQTLLALRLIDTPVSWLATDHAVYLGIVYSYFPFMVLPLYAALARMDEALLEAAADLGAPPWRTFLASRYRSRCPASWRDVSSASSRSPASSSFPICSARPRPR